ncbi:hypothetical protein PENNAL_c0003G08185 [Penicillium nalgiovense]|uniref:Carrier domain-containing protein n=1 Tax=Penicillium nalgiovense TaxID=60175 RepID=A0A1V6Z4X5_PENNA|nr:hypothetical protein PENNAL_c0003G08185 [Penicillium nalgiovense]CAG8059418.1 unnamed protein product [Penicillium nalgiovense]
MSLVQLNTMDILSADPFSYAEVLYDQHLGDIESLLHGHDLEAEWPATPAQCQILESDEMPWCKITLILPRQSAPDVNRIKASWTQICSHHCGLRTIFRSDPRSGQTYQRVVYRTPDIQWDTKPIGSNISSSNSSLADVPAEDDLAQLIVCRDPSTGSYRLTLRARRAAVDGTSLEIIKRNFVLLYCGLPLPEHTPLATYQRFLKETKDTASSIAFWKAQLSGAVPSVALPWETGLTDVSVSQDRQALRLHLDDNSHPGLSQIEHASGLPRKLIFETLWAYVLHCHSGSSDVLFAAVERDASFPDANSCVGYLDHTYPVRLSVSSDETFVGLSNRLTTFHQSASPHAYLGYNALSQGLTNPLESVLRYSPDPNGPTLAGQLAPFPLAMFINGTGVITLTLCHSPLTATADAQLLLDHFSHALYSALNKFYLPHARLEEIELGSWEEKLAQVHTAKALARPHQISTITRLFEEQVMHSPQAAAVQFEEDAPLSYAELNARANRMARALPPLVGKVVPVCLDRSTDLIITVLAILKSGGAYTVLDPEGPLERNSRIIETCSATMVLTSRRYAGPYPSALAIEDYMLAAGKEETSANLDIEIASEDPCYVVFTSGSTGTPKGAIVTHGAATNGMAYHTLSGKQRWLLFYNPTFSAAQRTMLSTLTHGGTLLLATKQSLTTRLADTIRTMQVDALGITPSALSLMEPNDVSNLKQVTLVGESISRELVTTWADHVDLRNTFGLSECAQLNFGKRLSRSSNPGIVGRPTDTTQAYVLKPGTTELTPMGVAGELCLVGPQLALGYLTSSSGAKKATAAAFVESPFGMGRMYRTGDVARIHADTSIEILGRMDFQVKLNGQKVNPAEVNRVLSQHEAVHSCSTVAVEMRERLVLVAAIVCASENQWSRTVSSIRDHSKQKLPAYMVPSLWMQMSKLPANGNGKVDVRAIEREALAKGWEGLVEAAASDAAVEAITDPTEQQIASVWADVLGLPQQSINRDTAFLSLGGTSIEGIKVTSELRKRGFAIDLGDVLGNATLKETVSYVTVVEDSCDDLQPFALVRDPEAQQEFHADPHISDAYPATPLQESLLASLGEDQGMYTYQRTWDVSRLDIRKLRDSFNAVLESSDILRTSFKAQGRSLLQVVRNDIALPWVEYTEDIGEYLARDKQQPFSLSGPLFRVAIISGQVLVVTMHHALFDYWSHRFVYQDVADVYLGLQLRPRPQFKHFVYHNATTSAVEHDRFWRTYLTSTEPSVINTVPMAQTTVAQRKLPEGPLRRSLQLHGLSLGAVLYGAWAIVLSNHTRHADVVFATTLSGRDVSVLDVDRLDGPTLTTVPQKVNVAPETTLLQLAQTVQANLSKILKHSQHGMRNALAAGHLPASGLDTMVNILVKDHDGDQADQIFQRYGDRPTWESEFTTLEVENEDEALVMKLSSKMEPRRVEFLLESYEKVLRVFMHTPTQRLSTLDIIGEAETEFLYNEISNRKSLHVPRPSLLHASFEDHARGFPDAHAIDWDGTIQLSYAELNARANRVAHYLTKKGVCVGDAIPLMLEKSIDTIVAILGVMKAGAAYVPLSPDNPVDRNTFIIDNVKARTILTEADYADMFSFIPNLDIVRIDTPEIDQFPASPTTVHIVPDNTAYIIYTSGSTGMPKGVQVPHRAAAAAVISMAVAESRYSGEWRTVQFANYVFDASVQDIFNTLSTGGTLCMAPPDKMQSDLPGVINAMSARQAILTPTVAKLLDPSEVPSFETLIVGGEPLTSDVIARWSPGHRILNVYGPTETSMVITTKEVDPSGRPSNIGAPFPTVMAFILHPDGTTMVPYGSVGELCVAGPQVTDGYVNREDLTKAAFMENTLGTDRMYRTGDLARWLPGGELECLGRKDNQVKIHGHRIELTEIEQAILKTGLVQGAVVLAVNHNGKKQLVAFCIFAVGSCEIQEPGDHEAHVQDLRAGLNTLSHYMVPKYILPVGDFPKMPSRKTDRKLLAKWVEQLDTHTISQYSFEGDRSQHEVVPVETEEESKLQDMWSKVLGLPSSGIGKKAHFLSLGGDSIAAIGLASVARSAGYLLSVKDILKNPILEDLTPMMRLDTRGTQVLKPSYKAPASVLDAIHEHGLTIGGNVEYIYPSPPGQAQFLEEGDRPEQMWVLMAVRKMPESANYRDWIHNTSRLTEINDILRTSWLRTSEAQWVGVVMKHSSLDVPIIPCDSEEEQSKIVEEFWNERFQFGKPFIKYAILLHSDNSWDVAIKMNHAAYDGTLLRTFDDHFAAIRRGTPIPSHGEFKDFADFIFRSDKDESLRFWAETMKDKHYTWPQVENPKITAAVRETFPRNLESVARAQGVTIPILFQAAYQLWLCRASGQNDVSFDYLLSGRNVDMADVDPQTINGTLANFLPVRAQIDPQSALGDYLETVQDIFWGITEHGDVGLHEIFNASGLSRTTSSNRCLFLYQPFEPAANSEESESDRWLVMAKSNVRMYQPYALVVEVAKALNNCNRLTVMYDTDVFNEESAHQIASEIAALVDQIADLSGQNVSLQQFLQ